MFVDSTKCVGCAQCVPYCLTNAIQIINGKAVIDQKECVECSACLYSNVCKKGALYMPKLEWPRILRAQYSDPRVKHPKTNMGGRGTEEVKTNDVTGRVKAGEVGITIEMGRPGLGTFFVDVEKMTKALTPLKVEWELANPVTALFDQNTGVFSPEVLNEKVLSCLLEMTVPLEKVEQVLETILDASKYIDTVFSLDFVSTYASDGSLPGLDVLEKLGLTPAPNAKYNLGMGRPLYKASN